MNLKLDQAWFERQQVLNKALRAEQDAIPDPEQTDCQDFETAVALYKRHSELYPKGSWLVTRRAWGGVAFAHSAGENREWCCYFHTGQLAGRLPYTPEPITEVEKAETDWTLARNLAWLDW